MPENKVCCFCSKSFYALRSDARYCSSTCKSNSWLEQQSLEKKEQREIVAPRHGKENEYVIYTFKFSEPVNNFENFKEKVLFHHNYEPEGLPKELIDHFIENRLYMVESGKYRIV